MAPGLLDDAALAALRRIVLRIYQQWHDEHYEEACRHHMVNMHSLTASRYFAAPFAAERAELFQIIAAPALTELIQEMFGSNIYFHGTQLFFHPLGGQRLPYWHRDLQYMGLGEPEQQALLPELLNLHVRIPLRHERGFSLVPGSHARWDTERERQVRLSLAGHHHSDELPDSVRFDLQPGDALIFHAHMLHRGWYQGNEQRMSFDIMLGQPHPLVIRGLDPEQLPTTAELPSLAQPAWYLRSLQCLAAREPAS